MPDNITRFPVRGRPPSEAAAQETADFDLVQVAQQIAAASLWLSEKLADRNAQKYRKPRALPR